MPKYCHKNWSYKQSFESSLSESESEYESGAKKPRLPKRNVLVVPKGTELEEVKKIGEEQKNQWEVLRKGNCSREDDNGDGEHKRVDEDAVQAAKKDPNMLRSLEARYESKRKGEESESKGNRLNSKASTTLTPKLKF